MLYIVSYNIALNAPYAKWCNCIVSHPKSGHFPLWKSVYHNISYSICSVSEKRWLMLTVLLRAFWVKFFPGERPERSVVDSVDSLGTCSFSSLSVHWDHLEGLSDYGCWAPWSSALVGLSWGWPLCISDKFPGGADAASLRAMPNFLLFWLFRQMCEPPLTSTFLRFYLLILERGERREKERERNTDVWEKHWSVAFCMLLLGDLAHNPGMCPDPESASDLSLYRKTGSPLSHAVQGLPPPFTDIFPQERDGT